MPPPTLEELKKRKDITVEETDDKIIARKIEPTATYKFSGRTHTGLIQEEYVFNKAGELQSGFKKQLLDSGVPYKKVSYSRIGSEVEETTRQAKGSTVEKLEVERYRDGTRTFRTADTGRTELQRINTGDNLEPTLKEKQREIVREKTGDILRVERKNDEITYFGREGSYTFPQDRLTFTGKDKPGGLQSRETVPLKSNYDRALETRESVALGLGRKLGYDVKLNEDQFTFTKDSINTHKERPAESASRIRRFTQQHEYVTPFVILAERRANELYGDSVERFTAHYPQTTFTLDGQSFNIGGVAPELKSGSFKVVGGEVIRKKRVFKEPKAEFKFKANSIEPAEPRALITTKYVGRQVKIGVYDEFIEPIKTEFEQFNVSKIETGKGKTAITELTSLGYQSGLQMPATTEAGRTVTVLGTASFLFPKSTMKILFSAPIIWSTLMVTSGETLNLERGIRAGAQTLTFKLIERFSDRFGRSIKEETKIAKTEAFDFKIKQWEKAQTQGEFKLRPKMQQQQFIEITESGQKIPQTDTSFPEVKRVTIDRKTLKSKSFDPIKDSIKPELRDPLGVAQESPSQTKLPKPEIEITIEPLLDMEIVRKVNPIPDVPTLRRAPGSMQRKLITTTESGKPASQFYDINAPGLDPVVPESTYGRLRRQPIIEFKNPKLLFSSMYPLLLTELKPLTTGFKNLRSASESFFSKPRTTTLGGLKLVSFPDQREKIKTDEDLFTRSVEDSKSKIINFSLSKSDISLNTHDILIETPRIRTDTFQDIREDISIRQDQPQEDKQRIITFPKIDLRLGESQIVVELPKIEPPEDKIKSPIKLSPEGKKKGEPKGEVFNVFAKEKGRFIRVNKDPLPFNKARNLGDEVVDNTASAQYKLKQAKGKAMADDITFRNKHKYQRKTKHSYIELNKHRIDTPGEIQGITVKGWLANKRKSRGLLF